MPKGVEHWDAPAGSVGQHPVNRSEMPGGVEQHAMDVVEKTRFMWTDLCWGEAFNQEAQLALLSWRP